MVEDDGAVPLCASADLSERGPARVFELLWRGEPMRGFALRFDGAVVAYLNRCAHVPSELDWVPGEFLDHERRFIVCATHGALYEPGDGRCRGGPCGRGRLAAIAVREAEGRVYWYPSADIRPRSSADPGPGSPA